MDEIDTAGSWYPIKFSIGLNTRFGHLIALKTLESSHLLKTDLNCCSFRQGI
jgi:hypothetical protein